jgi:hypothetical protein
MLAAIDMGSNSFHMVVARLVHGEIRTVEKMGEKVQLGAGLDQYNRLTEETQQRSRSSAPTRSGSPAMLTISLPVPRKCWAIR